MTTPPSRRHLYQWHRGIIARGERAPPPTPKWWHKKGNKERQHYAAMHLLHALYRYRAHRADYV